MAIESGDKAEIEAEKPEIEAEKAEIEASNRITATQKQAILEYLTKNISAKSSELAELVGVKSSRIKIILNEMIRDEIIVPEGSNKHRTYRLKS